MSPIQILFKEFNTDEKTKLARIPTTTDLKISFALVSGLILTLKQLDLTLIRFLAELKKFYPYGGITKYYSPKVTMHQESLDYNKH